MYSPLASSLYAGKLTAQHHRYALTIERGVHIDIAYLCDEDEPPCVDLIKVGDYWLRAIEIVDDKLLMAWHEELAAQLAKDAREGDSYVAPVSVQPARAVVEAS